MTRQNDIKMARERLNKCMRAFRTHPGANRWRRLQSAMYAYQQITLNEDAESYKAFLLAYRDADPGNKNPIGYG